MTSRSYCFTLNNPTTNEIRFEDLQHVRYAIWQLESGQNGTYHLQGYVELSSPQRWSYMSGILHGAHFEKRKGTREQARDYCRKVDTRKDGPFEYGSWENGGTGTRNDIMVIKRKLDEGIPEKQIADEHFGEWLRFYKGLREYKKLRTEDRDWKTEVIVLWGESGTGKSRKCREEAPTGYWKTRDEWWDAYDGQHDVIIDDFYGWLPFDFLLRLMDRYPLDVPSKGGFRRFVGRRLYITSNKAPEDWYPNIQDKKPLQRRIDQRIHYNASL